MRALHRLTTHAIVSLLAIPLVSQYAYAEPDEEGRDLYLEAIEAIGRVNEATKNLLFRQARYSNPKHIDEEAGFFRDNLTDTSLANLVNEDGQTLLMVAAAENNDPRFVRALLDAGAKIDTKDPQGRTALHHHAMSERAINAEITTMLLDAGADLAARDNLGRTTLLLAVEHEPKIDIVRTLLANNSPVNERQESKLGRTPLMVAAQFNTDPEMVRLLVAAGADLELPERETRMRAMHIAALYNTPQIVRELVQSGADLNPRMAGEATPLLLALSRKADPAIITALVDLGADTQLTGIGSVTAMNLAVQNDHPTEVLRALLDAGCDAQETTDRGVSFLQLVALGGTHPESIGLLVEHGLDPNQSEPTGIPILGLMVQSERSAAMITAVIDAGAEVDALYSSWDPSFGGGWTALLTAAYSSKDPEVVRALIKGGADVNRELPLQGMGLTPIVLSTNPRTSNPEIVLALLDAGADPTVEIQGKNLLDAVQENKKLSTNEELVERIKTAIEAAKGP
ncbi:MAG: ankyrin repeat domain-containing protein [Phycisphaerales bacterium]|nr:ankyrin repeat domain-containing protein [Phycisphaerales bacterium]